MRRFPALGRRWRRLCESCPAFLPLSLTGTHGTKKLPVCVAPAYRRASAPFQNARLKAGATSTKTKFALPASSLLRARGRRCADADEVAFSGAAAAGRGPDDVDRTILFGRLVRSLIDLHDHSGVLGSDERLLAARDAIQKVNGFGLHGSGVDVVDFFAGHGRKRKLDAALHGVDADVAVRVVHHDRTFAADHLDPCGREIRI